jgi:hypoxanthine phosphoribosyltransferase
MENKCVVCNKGNVIQKKLCSECLLQYYKDLKVLKKLLSTMYKDTKITNKKIILYYRKIYPHVPEFQLYHNFIKDYKKFSKYVNFYNKIQSQEFPDVYTQYFVAKLIQTHTTPKITPENSEILKK